MDNYGHHLSLLISKCQNNSKGAVHEITFWLMDLKTTIAVLILWMQEAGRREFVAFSITKLVFKLSLMPCLEKNQCSPYYFTSNFSPLVLDLQCCILYWLMNVTALWINCHTTIHLQKAAVAFVLHPPLTRQPHLSHTSPLNASFLRLTLLPKSYLEIFNVHIYFLKRDHCLHIHSKCQNLLFIPL